MATDRSQLFRKKSLEKMRSPERTDSLVKVVNPGIWILLTALALIVIGALVWAIFGNISTKVDVAFQSYAGESVFYLPEASMEGVSVGSAVTVDGEEGIVIRISPRPVQAAEVMDDYMIYVNGLYDNTWVYELASELRTTPGAHIAEITTGEFSPISMILGE